MEDTDRTNIGLSESAHKVLQQLKEDGHFAEMLHAYRFAIALALAHGAIAPKQKKKTTIFNVGSLDKDRSIATAIKAIRGDDEESVYETAERLAEWGVQEMAKLAEKGDLKFADLLEEAQNIGK